MRPGIYALGTVIIGDTGADRRLLWNDVQDNGPKWVGSPARSKLDGFWVFFIILTCIALILGPLCSADGHLRREGVEGCEPYVLMLLSATGRIGRWRSRAT